MGFEDEKLVTKIRHGNADRESRYISDVRGKGQIAMGQKVRERKKKCGIRTIAEDGVPDTDAEIANKLSGREDLLKARDDAGF